MQLSQELATYFGPNPYSRDPVVVGGLTLDDSYIAQAATIIGRVTAATGDLFECHPAADCADDGDRLASFISQWAFDALTLGSSFLHSCGHRRTGPASHAIWIGFHNPHIAASALSFAVTVCQAAARADLDAGKLRASLNSMLDAAAPYHPDFQSRVLMEGAKALDLPIMPAWNQIRHWQFGWGARSMPTFMGASNGEGVISNQLISNKRSSKSLIEYLGLPVPPDVATDKEEDIPAAVEKIGFPCVVKPANMGMGMGVSAGLQTIEQVRKAFALARKHTRQPIMLERHVPGADYRLMMADGNLVGVFRRDPPAVTGDGERTVRALVDELNMGRSPKGSNGYATLNTVDIDDILIQHLARQDLTLESVLETGRHITLRANGSISTGGTSTDVTDAIHPDVRKAAELLARTLDVRLAGFDYISPDISKSWRDGGGAFIELNLTPGLNVVTFSGRCPIETGKMALGSFPARIPLNCIVVPDGEVERAEAACLSAARDDSIAWASHWNAQAASLSLSIARREPWAGVNAILGNRMAERALVIAPSSHLQSYGLPVDKADGIWNCDPDLPAGWRLVLDSASASPVKHCSLDALLAGSGLPVPPDAARTVGTNSATL